MGENQKQCRVCGIVKPLSAYSPHRDASDGRKSICKPCNSKRTKLSKQTPMGMARSRYWNMISRVYGNRPKDKKHYADKGITVCDEWRSSFSKFFEDMGPPPSAKHQLDRINSDLGYFKGNCRWVTPSEQSRNRAYGKVSFGGKQLLPCEIAELTGASIHRVYRKIYMGQPLDDLWVKS